MKRAVWCCILLPGSVRQMEFAWCGTCQATGDGERAFKNKGYYAIENEIRLQIAYERGQSKRYIL